MNFALESATSAFAAALRASRGFSATLSGCCVQLTEKRRSLLTLLETVTVLVAPSPEATRSGVEESER